jgi:hypothetical protein
MEMARKCRIDYVQNFRSGKLLFLCILQENEVQIDEKTIA